MTPKCHVTWWTNLWRLPDSCIILKDWQKYWGCPTQLLVIQPKVRCWKMIMTKPKEEENNEVVFSQNFWIYEMKTLPRSGFYCQVTASHLAFTHQSKADMFEKPFPHAVYIEESCWSTGGQDANLSVLTFPLNSSHPLILPVNTTVRIDF